MLGVEESKCMLKYVHVHLQYCNRYLARNEPPTHS